MIRHRRRKVPAQRRPGWFEDPQHEYAYRYWDGLAWTRQVIGWSNRPAPEHPGSPGWFPDPDGRFRYRFWDGAGWTSRVVGWDGAIHEAWLRDMEPGPTMTRVRGLPYRRCLRVAWRTGMWTPNVLASLFIMFVKAAEYRRDGVPEALLRDAEADDWLERVRRHPPPWSRPRPVPEFGAAPEFSGSRPGPMGLRFSTLDGTTYEVDFLRDQIRVLAAGDDTVPAGTWRAFSEISPIDIGQQVIVTWLTDDALFASGDSMTTAAVVRVTEWDVSQAP